MKPEIRSSSFADPISKPDRPWLVASNNVVYCVLCIAPDGAEITHIFSTSERRELFVAADYLRNHISYDYTLDAPERHEEPIHDN